MRRLIIRNNEVGHETSHKKKAIVGLSLFFFLLPILTSIASNREGTCRHTLQYAQQYSSLSLYIDIHGGVDI